MGFMASFRDLRCFRNYAEALEHYNKVKPIKNRSPEVRPLGERREWNKCSITKNADESIGLVMYSTEVVRINPDNSFQIHVNGWHTASTAAFINACTPVLSAFTHDQRTAVRLRSGDYFVPTKGLLLAYNASNTLEIHPDQPIETEYNYIIDRTVSNALYAQYKHFIKYVKGLCKLRDNGDGYIELSYEEANGTKYVSGSGTFWSVYGLTHDRLTQKLSFLLDPDEEMTDDNIDNWREAFTLLALCVPVYSHAAMGSPMHIPIKRIMPLFRECLLRENAGSVLKPCPLPRGQLPHNRYKDWL